MVYNPKNLVRETTLTTGTGTLTLAGVVAGQYQAWSAVGNGNTAHYRIRHRSADEWEIGLGTVGGGGTTLARTTVLASSNAGSAVALSAGIKDVYTVNPSELLAVLGQLASQELIGRNTAGAGLPERVSLSQVLDWISTTPGVVPYRGAAVWGSLLLGSAASASSSAFDAAGTAAAAVAAHVAGTAGIADGAVTLAKQASMASASVFYRKTAGAGAPEVQTLATLKADLGLTGTNSGDQVLGRLTGRTVLTSGSGTFTVGAGVVALDVEQVGGGGGGAGAEGITAQIGVGGGGASGGYLRKLITSLAASYAYAVGAGGAGGAAGNNAGSAGGDTTFGAALTAGGGGGGSSLASGTTVAATSSGAAGTATGGDLNVSGAQGPRGFRFSGTQGLAGAGASSFFGSGGLAASTDGAGVAATTYGAGGGGGCARSATSRAGGDGMSGVIVINQYIST